jgi:hypothetical protein
MSNQIICSGCNKPFAHSSWGLHISKTTNPPCRAIYEKQKAYLPGGSHQTSPQIDPGNISDENYLEDDYDNGFAGWDDDADQLTDEETSDSESESSESEESDWDEPLTEPGWDRGTSPVMPMEVDPGNEMDEERGRHLTEDERKKLAEGMRARPIVSVYPSVRAGEVIEAGTRSAYHEYEQKLPGVDHTNPYGEFATKVGWDFAKWAKTRGPGSTAASELMGIGGVSPSAVIILHYANGLQATRKTRAPLQE